MNKLTDKKTVAILSVVIFLSILSLKNYPGMTTQEIVEKTGKYIGNDNEIWIENSIERGRRLAERENKEVVVYFFNPDCRYCEDMQQAIEANRESLREYVLVKVDTKMYKGLSFDLKVYSTPMIVIFDSEGNEVQRIYSINKFLITNESSKSQ